MDLHKLEAVMRDLALRAGARIMDIYARDDLQVASKADASPVTEADEVADRLIAEGLRAAFPDIPLVTEEQAASHGQEVSTFLIVDPLDGTKEFIQRRGEFTVNIAYVEDGVPLRGIVYAPATGRLFYTEAGGRAVEEQGAHADASVGRVRAIAVSSPDPAALVVVASKSHRDAATDAYIHRYRVET